MSRVVSAAALTCAVVATVLIPSNLPSANAAEPPKVVLASPDLQRRLSDAVLSADGRYVGFLSEFGSPTNYEVRDLFEGTTTAVPSGVEGTTGEGSMSGSGRLVAFAVEQASAPLHQTLFVVDRDAPAESQVHQVTGTANDLPYLRTAGCGTEGGQCPALSHDGTTLVSGVSQSIESPALELTLDDGEPLRDPDTGSFEPLIDFGISTQGSSVDLHVAAEEPVVFPETGPELSGDPAFQLGTSNAPCTGPLAAGQQCTVSLTIPSGTCQDQVVLGRLRLPGNTPAGQTAVALVADCPEIIGDAVSAAAAAPCSGASGYDGPLPSPTEPDEDRFGNPEVAFGESSVGELRQFAVPVTNASDLPGTVNLYADAGCPFKLVVPKSQPADACQQGATLEPEASCVAYLEFVPGEVAPYAGTIRVGSTWYRLVASAGQGAVAAWRDASGQGNFAAAGPPRIVSVTGPDGTPMNGSAPSVSADGRWVAYTSTSKLGRPAGDTTNRQVYVHDTNVDGSGGHGQTVLASLLPDGRLLLSADRPSLSGDGSRVAFADTHEVEPEPAEYINAFVRDLPMQRTIVASSSPTGEPGDNFSAFPVMSNDGGSVAYMSTSRNLLSEPLPDGGAWQIYVRDVNADFTGGRGVNQLMSVNEAGQPAQETGAYNPAINADGSVVAFETDDKLTANDVEEEPLSDVYASTRAGKLAVSPGSIDLGQTPVKSKSAPQVVTVSNTGSPMTIGQARVEAPFVIESDQCSHRALRDGEHCTLNVAFAPTQVGRRSAWLNIPGPQRPDGAELLTVDLSGEGTSDATTPGETKHVSVDDSPSSAIQNDDPAISNDGRFVAFWSVPRYIPEAAAKDESLKGPTPRKVTKGPAKRQAATPAKKQPKQSAVVAALVGDAIHLRDQASGTTERISPAGVIPGSGPDVSGTAQLVSYLAMLPDEEGEPLERTANVWAVNRKDPAAPVARQVTGTPSDLPYQRTPTVCESTYYCQPRLSDDGTAIVFGAEQTIFSDSLIASVPDESGEPAYVKLADFSPTQPGGTLRQTVTFTASDALEFTGPPVIEGGDGAFTVVENGCDTALGAGESCAVDLDFAQGSISCGRTYTASLRTQGTVPAGQTVMPLIGTLPCPVIINAVPGETSAEPKAAPKAEACTPIAAPDFTPGASTGLRTNVGNVVNYPETLDVGKIAYSGLQITNDGSVSATVRFESPQCGMSFVTPPEPDPQYPTCTDGQTLAAGATCAAYAGIRPEEVGSILANVSLVYSNGINVHRFIAYGERHVVLMRRDPSGAGDFAGAGRTAPEVVSVDGDGAAIQGENPAVSGDGRYVAFESRDPLGREPDEFANVQIYLRDRTAKTTKLISQLPDGSLDEIGAENASISRDGSRIAYETKRYREGDPTPPYSDVYVHDLPSGRVLLASGSVADSKAGGNSDSYDAALSDDGTTVAFTSMAENLVEQPTTGRGTVYVREIEADFAGEDPRVNEIVSLTNEGRVVDGSSYGATVNEDGAFVAFGSSGQLVPEDTDDGTWDVYVRRRFAQLQVEPAALDFGTQKVATKSEPKRATVRNVGPGTVDIGALTTKLPFAVEGENCAKLRRNKSCTVDVTFAPTAEGTFSDAVNLAVSQGYLALPPIAATLAGVGKADPLPVKPAAFTVTPKDLDFGGINLGDQATPKPLVVANVGQVPLAMTVTALSDGDIGDIGDFAADGTPCAVVMPGQSCTVDVQFAPRAKGERSGKVTFAADAQDPLAADPKPVDVPLAGVGVDDGTPQVAAMSVEPKALAYPAGVLGIQSAAKLVTVRNVGTVPLAVASETTSVDGDFASASTGCLVLLPGRQCTIGVRFTPRGLGLRDGALDLSAASIDPNVVRPFPVKVLLTGSTKLPKIVLDPVIGKPGQVTMVRGENFPPTSQIALSWQLGLGVAAAVPDAKGTFTASMLVFRRDQLGERLLNAAIPGITGPVVSPPYLVEPLSSQPPGFYFRW